MVYDIAGGHDMIWYGLEMYGMVYDKAWRGMAWYVQMLM